MKTIPIKPRESDTSSYSRKLQELVRRMQKDYDEELKPLVKKMSKRRQEHIAALPEAPNVLAKDAEKYFTTYETARLLGTIKERVLRDIKNGKIEGTILKDGDYLIPEGSVDKYAAKIGKATADDLLLEKFNNRLERLRSKYQDLIYAYQSMAKAEAERVYRYSKEKFRKQFQKAVGINISSALTERGLKAAFEAQIEQNVSLIKSIPEKYFGNIQTMVTQSITGQKKFEGGILQALQDLTGVTKTKAKLISRDQTAKAVSTYSHMRMQNIGIVGYKWMTSKDERVAGNPSGKYPDVDPRSKFHGNHWERHGKYFLFHPMKNPPKAPDGKPFRQPPPDGAPGMGIQCRCFADPVIPDID
jgi:uncharacterized protein with gpF-like domain